jgi:hypothetical protein
MKAKTAGKIPLYLGFKTLRSFRFSSWAHKSQQILKNMHSSTTSTGKTSSAATPAGTFYALNSTSKKKKTKNPLNC